MQNQFQNLPAKVADHLQAQILDKTEELMFDFLLNGGYETGMRQRFNLIEAEFYRAHSITESTPPVHRQVSLAGGNSDSPVWDTDAEEI